MNNALLLALLLATGAHPAAAAIRDAAGSGLVLEHGTPPRHRDGVTRHALRVDRRDIERTIAAGRPLLLPSIDGSPVPAADLRLRRRADGISIVTGRVDTAAGPQSFVLTLGVADAGGDAPTFAFLPQRDGSSLRIETKEGRTGLVEDRATI